MNRRRIHILCLKPEICALIKKSLSDSRYNVTCTKREEINFEFVENFTEHIDCLILDKDIDFELREKIKEKYNGISIVCLPSLDSENGNKSIVKNMSEPLKLSELSGYINSIFQT
jgi:DNA-binding response OmpR family regulator